jgi:hypothetical protein
VTVIATGFDPRGRRAFAEAVSEGNESLEPPSFLIET